MGNRIEPFGFKTRSNSDAQYKRYFSLIIDEKTVEIIIKENLLFSKGKFLLILINLSCGNFDFAKSILFFDISTPINKFDLNPHLLNKFNTKPSPHPKSRVSSFLIHKFSFLTN